MAKYEPESTWNALETTELKSISMGSENFLKRGHTLESLVSTWCTIFIGM
jgi:hypothetical protein